MLRFRRKPKKTTIDRFRGLPGAPQLAGRLDPHRTRDLAQPKVGVRERSEANLEWCRNLGFCEICGKPGPTDPCHVATRGSGGSDNLSNLVAGCRICHRRTEDAGQAGKDELLAVIASRPSVIQTAISDNG